MSARRPVRDRQLASGPRHGRSLNKAFFRAAQPTSRCRLSALLIRVAGNRRHTGVCSVPRAESVYARDDQISRPPRLACRLPLDPVRLLRARQRIRDYLRGFNIDASTVNDVVLALQEAMTNAVLHSDASDDRDVSLAIDGGDLTATRDRGRGFATATFDPDEIPGLDEPGGRGLYLAPASRTDSKWRLGVG
jgi:anti-sigma regulatory factor (Ser/Thr protein kinase)